MVEKFIEKRSETYLIKNGFRMELVMRCLGDRGLDLIAHRLRSLYRLTNPPSQKYVS